MKNVRALLCAFINRGNNNKRYRKNASSHTHRRVRTCNRLTIELMPTSPRLSRLSIGRRRSSSRQVSDVESTMQRRRRRKKTRWSNWKVTSALSRRSKAIVLCISQTNNIYSERIERDRAAAVRREEKCRVDELRSSSNWCFNERARSTYDTLSQTRRKSFSRSIFLPPSPSHTHANRNSSVSFQRA